MAAGAQGVVPPPLHPVDGVPSIYQDLGPPPAKLQTRVKRFVGAFAVLQVFHLFANFNLFSLLWLVFLVVTYKVRVYFGLLLVFSRTSARNTDFPAPPSQRDAGGHSGRRHDDAIV